MHLYRTDLAPENCNDHFNRHIVCDGFPSGLENPRKSTEFTNRFAICPLKMCTGIPRVQESVPRRSMMYIFRGRTGKVLLKHINRNRVDQDGWIPSEITYSRREYFGISLGMPSPWLALRRCLPQLPSPHLAFEKALPDLGWSLTHVVVPHY